MFIPESEAIHRLSTEENLLVRLNRSSSESALLPSDINLPPALPLDIHQVLDPFDGSFNGKIPELEEEKGPIDLETVDSRKARKELERLLNPSSYPGRGTKDLSRDTQAAIGVTAGILGTTKASRLGDVAISQAHSYERGYTDPVSLSDPRKSPKEELRAKIIEGHGIVVDKAFSRLLKTLDLLDDNKLTEVKRATDLSVIAKNLSGVVQHATMATQDKVVENNEKSVHFHIMKPEQATDEDYPTLTINASASPEYRKETELPE